MEKLKDLYYGKPTFKQLAKDLAEVYPTLNETRFYQDAIKDLETLELKDRIKRTAQILQKHLPQNYNQALKVLYAYCKGKENNFYYLFVPTFIMIYGQHDYDKSMQALHDLTEFSSSEEAIRPFIAQDVKKSLKLIKLWTKSKNYHIRRLASEGTRPRLPWAKQIPEFIKEPSLAWPILEALNKDTQKYVQKSVANHINDISKDHPSWVVKQVKKWDLSHPVTFWIVKHGMRTLIKRGQKDALTLFGWGKEPLVEITKFELSKKHVTIDEAITLSCALTSTSKRSQQLVIDYAIHFVKKSGQTSPKVFKLKQMELLPNQTMSFQSKYTFKNYSTRVHHTGKHKIEILINGVSLKGASFEFSAK